ncbi:hypothetical protein B0H13DRAFT_2263924 [Mycena leptocephala]|nr:hypothetical protein B0H13DRAFT_2263924 [Mycena leptocephala]
MQTTCLRRNRPTDFWASCPSTDDPEAPTQQKQLPSAGGNPSSLDDGHGVQGGQSVRWYPRANHSVRQVCPGSMMANRSIGIRESKGSKTTTKKQRAPAGSRVEILPKMAMMESKMAGRSGGIRGLSIVGNHGIGPDGPCAPKRQRIECRPSLRLANIAPAPVRFREKRRNVKRDIVFLRQGMANPRKDTSRINIPDGTLVQGSTNGQVLKTSKR